MNDCEERVFDFVKSYLLKIDPTLNLHELNINTDLAAFGIESIAIVSLIAEIEEELKINISLSSLEKFNYMISVKSICGSRENKL